MTTLKTGGDVDAFCTRCRLELAHVIVAMAQSRPVRVQCKTCRTVHAFKRTAEATPRRRGESAEPRRKRGGVSRADYDELMRGRDISRAQKYRPVATFDGGDVLSHPSFGVGVVTRVLGDGKIEVLFQAGTKVLVHARGLTSRA